MSQQTRSKVSKSGRKEELKQKLETLPLLGQIITWSPGTASHKYTDIVHALKDVGLDHKIARELLPRHAFARACKKLDEERVIDHLKEDGDSITFQFTKKTMSEEIWKYAKETNLTINKTTGVVTCDNDNLRHTAQKELNRCLEERTSNDITKIVQRLFDKESDGCPLLFPIREQGGAYFVFKDHINFVDRVSDFLTKIGGRLDTFPVADATSYGGKNTGVTNSIAETLEGIMKEHETAIAKFGLDTRQGTLESAAQEIRKTKAQVQALAMHLGHRAKELEAFADASDEKLRTRIEQLSQTRATAPQTTESRGLIFGHSITAVIRWMGKTGNWSFKEVRHCLDGLGFPTIAEPTIRCQLQAGKTGERGDPAHITKEQAEELRQAVKDQEKKLKEAKDKEEK